MKIDEDSGGMWCLVMFDLPVLTKKERHDAAVFRHVLQDMGYCMIQFSVYARYSPTADGNRTTVIKVKENLPPNGKVVPDLLRKFAFARLWCGVQFASLRLSSSRDMSR